MESGVKKSIQAMDQQVAFYYRNNPVFQYQVEAVNSGFNQYSPSPGLPLLTQEIQRYYSRVLKIDVEAGKELVVLAGLKTAFYNYVNTFLTKKATVVVLTPSNPVFLQYLEFEGFRVVKVDAVADLEDKLAGEDGAVEMLLLSNCGSDVAVPYALEELEQISRIVQRFPGLNVLCDESYHSYSENFVSILSLPGMRQRVTGLYSGDIEFNAESLNISWVIINPGQFDLFSTFHCWTHYCPNTTAQYAVGKMLQGRSDPDIVAVLDERKARFSRNKTELERKGLRVFEPEGNFGFLRVDSSTFEEEGQLEKDYCIKGVDSEEFGVKGGKWIRLTPSF